MSGAAAQTSLWCPKGESPDRPGRGMVKCITICQPWPWAIVWKLKRIENRTWPTKWRGLLCIHAGLSEKWLGGYASIGNGPEPEKSGLVFGAIVGVVDMSACLARAEVSLGKLKSAGLSEAEAQAQRLYAEGPWCHIYTHVRRFVEPVPYKGAQGLFDVPLGVVGEALRTAVEVGT